MNCKCSRLMLMALGLAYGQEVPRTIDVASIHLAEFPSEAFFEGFTAFGSDCGLLAPILSGNRAIIERTPLCGLIREAYQLRTYRITGIPSSLANRTQANYFTIQMQAEGDGPLSREDARVLLREILTQRFQLKFHWEKRDLPVYALRVGKNGPKMPTRDLDNCNPRTIVRSDPNGSRAITNCKANTTMAELAASLTFDADRPVIDETNLLDRYVVRLNWSPDGNGTAPSLFTAIQEQLGLKLEPKQAPVDIMVLDQAERPSEN